MSEQTEVKPGKQTSEFWLSIIVSAVPILIAVVNHMGGYSISGETVAMFLTSALTAAGYSISRGMAKKQPDSEPAKFDTGAILEAARQEAQRVATEQVAGQLGLSTGESTPQALKIVGAGFEGRIAEGLEYSEPIYNPKTGEPLPEYSEPDLNAAAVIEQERANNANI